VNEYRGSEGVPSRMTDLDENERAELLRLRAEVADLRVRVGRRDTGRRDTGRRVARWSLASVLLVLSTLVAVAAVVGVYARTELLDTDRYVETVAPLARDPAVQQAVAARLTDELVTRVDLAGLLQQLVDALEERGAPEALNGLVGPITNGVRSFIDTQVRAVLASEQFAQVWDAANRVAHDELDAVLTTGKGQFLSVDGDTLYLNLGGIIAMVKQRLVDAGLTLVERVPDFSITVPLVASADIPRVQRWVRLLNTAAWVLPLAALALLAGAVMAAPNRRRGLLLGAAGFAIGMLVLLAVLAAGRGYYLDHLPATVRSPDAAAVVYDTLVRFLIASAQTLAVLAAIVVVGCWLAGPGRSATAIRGAGGWLLDRLAALLSRLRLPLGEVPVFVAQHRRAIEAGLVVLFLAVLVIWRQPGVSGTLWLAAGLLLAVALVELFGRLHPDTAPSSPNRHVTA
jgi:hypothetical protein